MVENIAFIVFLVGMVFMVLAALAGKVNISLVFLVPLLPLQNVIYRFHKFPLGKDFVDIVLVAMIVGWILKTLLRGERFMEKTPFNVLFILTILYTYFSLWRGSFYLDAAPPLSGADVRLQDWKNYMILPLLYFLTVNNVRTTGQAKWLIIAMMLSMLLVDFYTGKQIRFMTSPESRSKIVGTFVWLGPNQLAAFYVEAIFIMLGILIVHKEKLLKLLFAGLLVPAFTVILFLYSRGAYAAVITGLLAISFIKSKKWIIPLLILLISWQFILPQTVIDRIRETRTSSGDLDSSSRQRLELWKESFQLFAENPLLGIGFDVINARGLQRGFKDTHNIYMKILAEQGVAGMLLFLAMMFLALREGVLLHRHAGSDTFFKGLGLGFVACVVATMTTNMFGDRWTYIQIGSYFWVFLGLVVRGRMIVEEDAEKEGNEEYSSGVPGTIEA